MNGTPRDILRAVIDAPARVAEIPAADVPAILGTLAELQATLTLRLMTGANAGGESEKASAEPDRLLTAEEAAPILGVAPRWLYRHAKGLPFARRLSRKALRFSEAGLRRYAQSRRA
jgi:predicted DNA-binding transcriptional regulator AlpA